MRNYFKEHFIHPYFLVGLLIRLILMPIGGSSYLRDFFIPFIDSAVNSPGHNPWMNFSPEYFPYGSVLFAILYLPRFFLHSVLQLDILGSTPQGLFTFKLPMLCLDVLFYIYLCRFAREHVRKISIYYWLNPIALFITYYYGQLDLAAMCFCFISIYYLISAKFWKSALFFSFATLCKFHVVAILPFLMVFIWNRFFRTDAIKKIGLWMSLWASLTALGFLPLLFARRFSYVTASSPEAFRLFAMHLDLNGQTLYLGVIFTLLMLGRLCISRRITDFGLIFGSGAIFTTLLLVTNPFPGWYFWVLPFMALFFTIYAAVPRLFYILFVVAYFAYFLVMEPSIPYSELAAGVSLSILQACLIGVWITIWILAISKEAPLNQRMSPLLIGVSGDSGAGKNYFSQTLADVFSHENTSLVEGDDYHKWARGDPSWAKVTHLNPNANFLSKLIQHARSLASGVAIQHHHYDHTTGSFSESREISPNKTMIIQGLHTLYARDLLDILHLKIFLNPDESVRTQWKLERDLNERKSNEKKVLSQIESRRSDSIKYIQPQRSKADWILEYLPVGEVTSSIYKVRHTFWHDVMLMDMFLELKRIEGLEVEQLNMEDDGSRVSFILHGKPSAQNIADWAEIFFPYMRHITRARVAPKWRNGLEGINQLIAIAMCARRL